MRSSISLLYSEKPEGESGERLSAPLQSVRDAVYNLNIDRMARHACESDREVQYFLDVLCRTPSGTRDAVYRAEILRDFIDNPSLLSELMQLFRSYDNLRAENEEMTKEIFRYGVPSSALGLLDCTYEELYINAHFARSVIACFSEIHELFSSFGVNSEGLKRMKEFCLSMKESRCIDEVERAAERFRSESAGSYRFTVKLSLNEAMEAVRCTVLDITEASKQDKKGLRDIFRKKSGASKAPSEVDIGTSAADNSCSAVTAALAELSSLFSDIALEIYSVFLGIGEELRFYRVACDMAQKLETAGLSYCFPEVAEMEEDCLSARSVYDMLLLTEGKDVSSIVPNDIEMTTNGVLAIGDNNCGKTSFLRAVGSAVLFAQNGLFVCADYMRVSVRSGIFSHFSSAEKDFTIGDSAGRFEGEVMDIAKIVDALTPYSLVLLNESFQTTAYREGAEGMKTILDILPRIKVRYIFVTHMKAIFRLFQPGEVTVLRAAGAQGADKYKLLKE